MLAVYLPPEGRSMSNEETPRWRDPEITIRLCLAIYYSLVLGLCVTFAGLVLGVF